MSKRLASLDALRGCTVAAMLLVNDPGDWDHVHWPLDHATWNGCTPTDLVFPFFLFVVGVSVALAMLPRREQGADRAALTRSALKRAVRIVGLGVLNDDQRRPRSALMSIAIASTPSTKPMPAPHRPPVAPANR